MEQLKIISGGQTGIDRMALEVARGLGLPTGGTAARDFMTEAGPDPGLKDFGLVECQEPGYPARTRQNILDADGTVIYGNPDSRGSILAVKLCGELSKPFLINPEPAALARFLKDRAVGTLNVAGNRKSRLTAAQLVRYSELFARSLEEYSLVESKDVRQGPKARR
jgi:hypothetical protein